jgi:hypothetical protein
MDERNRRTEEQKQQKGTTGQSRFECLQTATVQGDATDTFRDVGEEIYGLSKRKRRQSHAQSNE